MEYREFGEGNEQAVLLLHGGGLSWWNYRKEAEILQARFHVILPVLDGHAGSSRPFASIGDNAAEIISFMDRNLNGQSFLIGGLSLGGQVLLEMLSRRGDLCRHALVESAMAIPSRLMEALIGPSLAFSFGLIQSRAFARLQFRSLHMPEELFEDYYRDTCRITRSDMTAFLKANAAWRLKDAFGACSTQVHVFAGEKENRGILRSAKLIHERAAGSDLTILPGLYHGGFSLCRPDLYAKFIEDLAGL